MRLLRLILFKSLTYIMNEKIKLNNCKNKFFINKKKETAKNSCLYLVQIVTNKEYKIYDISYYIKSYCNCQVFSKKKKKQASDQLACFQM